MSADTIRLQQLTKQLKELNDQLVSCMNEIEVIRDRRADLEISKDTVSALTVAINDIKASSDMLDVVEANLNAIKS